MTETTTPDTKTDDKGKFYNLKQLQEAFDKHYEERRKEESDPRTFDFKKVGQQLEKEYMDLAATLDLPFYVDIQKCARGIYRVILSEHPLDKALRHRPLDQRTFVWAGKNRKGKTADTVLLTHDKFYTDVPMRPEILGIKKRELRIVEVHFLATSDKFFDDLIKDIRLKCKLNTPAERDLDMTSRLLDARVCEKVLGVNKILVSENQKVIKDAEWTEKTSERRLYNKLEKFLEDAESSGKVVKDSRFGGITLIPKSAMDVLKLLIILVGAYFIIGLVLSNIFGMAIPGIGGGPAAGGGDAGPGTADPYDPGFVLFSLLRWLL